VHLSDTEFDCWMESLSSFTWRYKYY